MFQTRPGTGIEVCCVVCGAYFESCESQGYILDREVEGTLDTGTILLGDDMWCVRSCAKIVKLPNKTLGSTRLDRTGRRRQCQRREAMSH